MARRGVASSRGMTRFGLAAVLFTLASGCATVQPIAPIDTSAPTWRDPSLSRQEVRQAGVAVLPVRATQPRNAAAGADAGERLAQALVARPLATAILPPSEVRERFEREGITGDVEDMICRLDETGRFDRETLDRMGRATGCRFFLQASLVTAASTEYADGAAHASHAVETRLHAQLWDAATGEVVWEGVGGGAALSSAPHGGRFEHATAIAIPGLARVVERAPHEEPEPRSVAALHAADHAAHFAANDTNARNADFALTSLVLLAEIAEVAVAIAGD